MRTPLISVNRLGLDSFIVNSMAIMGNSSILALGIEDYGIILYDIVEFKIFKFVPIISYLEGE